MLGEGVPKKQIAKFLKAPKFILYTTITPKFATWLKNSRFLCVPFVFFSAAGSNSISSFEKKVENSVF